MAADWKQKGLFPISKYLSCRFLLMEIYIVIATELVFVLRLTGNLFRAFPDFSQKAAESDPINEGKNTQKLMFACTESWSVLFMQRKQNKKKNGADAHEVSLF